MRWSAPLIPIFVFGLILGLISCDSKKEPDDILATVGEDKISFEQFKQAYLPVLLYTNKKESGQTREEILTFLIDQSMLAQEARSLDLDTVQTIQTLSRAAEKTAFTRILYKEWVKDQISEPGEEELRTAYLRSHNSRLVRHLFTPDKESALHLYEQVSTGADWDSLASTTFRDPSLAANGGVLGWMKFGDMTPEFEDAVYQLSVHQISPPVQTEFGWHIIRVDDEVKALMPTEYDYSLERRGLSRTLVQRKRESLAKKVIEQKMTDANLVFHPQNAPQAWDILSEQLRRLDADGTLTEAVDQEYMHFSERIEDMADREMLRFKDEIWTVAMFLERLPEVNRDLLFSDIKKATGFLVRDEIIYQEGLSRGLDQREDVVSEVQNRIDQYLSNLYLRYLAENQPLDRAAVERHYQEHASNRYQEPDSLLILEMIFKNRKDAIKFHHDNSGMYSQQAGMEHSTQPKLHSLGWFKGARKDRPDYYHRLVGLPVRSLAGPIQIPGGSVLITAVKRQRHLKPLDSIYSQVEQDARTAHLRLLRFQETKRLEAKYEITIDRELLHDLEL